LQELNAIIPVRKVVTLGRFTDGPPAVVSRLGRGTALCQAARFQSGDSPPIASVAFFYLRILSLQPI
jgi:hypothetical protein